MLAMANPNFVPVFSSDEVWRGQDTTRCISDDLTTLEEQVEGFNGVFDGLDLKYANIKHQHNEYATTDAINDINNRLATKSDRDHTHPNLADINHTHDEYAEKNHVHSEYATSDHNHDNNYALLTHEHDQYASTTHNHVANQITDLPGAIKKYLLSDVFKVGYVWTSYTNTSPASILGGTWTELKGVFPYYNASTATGGSNTHKLSSGEMPTHKHDARIHITGSEAKGYGLAQSAGFKDRVVVAYGGYGYYTGDTGGNGSHNNMPKYQSLYAWRRSA